MSRHTKHRKAEPPPDEDREQFIRDNAVAVVCEKDELIRRLRKTVARLEKAVASLRLQLKREREGKT